MIAAASQSTVIGVGIDTSRYGHHVTFLQADLQPATKPIEIRESREGYDELLHVLQDLNRRFPSVKFHIRVDVIVAPRNWTTTLGRNPGRIGPVVGGKHGGETAT
jgi:hypothetical protein